VPVIGSPDAEQFIFFWFDYTDMRSRRMFAVLSEVVDAYAGRIAIITLPYPRNGACNPQQMFQQPTPIRANACEYARLALTVWKAKPAAFASFHSWLMQGTKPPTVAQARERAAELVGTESLEPALGGPAVAELLFGGIGMIPRRFGAIHPIPKTVWYARVITGDVMEFEQLVDLLKVDIGIEPPMAKLNAVAAPSQAVGSKALVATTAPAGLEVR
jgi:hypothetical protein